MLVKFRPLLSENGQKFPTVTKLQWVSSIKDHDKNKKKKSTDFFRKFALFMGAYAFWLTINFNMLKLFIKD